MERTVTPPLRVGGCVLETGEGWVSLSPSLPDPLTVDNRELLAGLLEVIVVLWEGVRERITTPKQRLLQSKLESNMAESLPTFFNALPVRNVNF